jgi:hypothetical protein
VCPAGFDVGSDRGQRAGWRDDSTFHKHQFNQKICRYNCVAGSGFVDQFPDRDRMLLVSGWSGDNLSNDEERSLLGLHIDPTKIFANYGKREQLYRCE